VTSLWPSVGCGQGAHEAVAVVCRPLPPTRAVCLVISCVCVRRALRPSLFAASTCACVGVNHVCMWRCATTGNDDVCAVIVSDCPAHSGYCSLHAHIAPAPQLSPSQTPIRPHSCDSQPSSALPEGPTHRKLAAATASAILVCSKGCFCLPQHSATAMGSMMVLVCVHARDEHS
jgi:hypothetical protein